MKIYCFTRKYGKIFHYRKKGCGTLFSPFSQNFPWDFWDYLFTTVFWGDDTKKETKNEFLIMDHHLLGIEAKKFGTSH